MAGVNISVDVDDSRFKAALAKLQQQAHNLEPAYARIASRLLASAQRRFETQTDPEGKAWEPLKESTLAARAKAGKSGGILKVNGYLLNSLEERSSNQGAQVGSNWLYARIHQLGGTTKAHVIRPINKKALAFGGVCVKQVNHPGSKIPARAYLGVDDSDAKAIEHIISSYLEQT